MPEIISAYAEPYYDLMQNKNIRRERYVVEGIVHYPGTAKNVRLWYHKATFYKEHQAQKYAHGLRGETRVLRIAAGETYQEGWDKI